MITLEYDGDELTLAEWGIAIDSPVCRRINLSPSTYSVFVPNASVSDDPLFAFESKIIIRRNRSGSSGAGFTGGFVAFIGYAMPAQAAHDGESSGVTYQFLNAWYWLDQTCFMMRYASYNVGSSAVEYKYLSEVQLFTKLDGSNVLQPQSSAEQIEEVLDFCSTEVMAAGHARPYLVGTIDPDIDFPSYQARELMCSAALIKCLQMSPDVNCWFDYSTTSSGQPTPTIHFLSRSSRTDRSLSILNGVDHRQLQIAPRPDLQVRSVVIQYKITGTADGQTWILRGDAQKDKYGPNGANNVADPDRGPRVLLQTIDLQGAVTTSLSVDIEVAAINANHATEATRIAWWKSKVPWLNSDKIASVAIPATATVKDVATGASVTLATFPNELTRGQIAAWTGFAQKWIEIRCKATFKTYATAAAASGAVANLQTEDAVEKEISVKLLATDGETGTYTAPGTSIAGEDVPVGVAQKVYESLATLQFDGQDIRVQPTSMNAAGNGPLIDLNHNLNLTGGRSEWTTMKAQLQTIVEHDGWGMTTITFGPARHISAGDLAAMFQWNRWRRYWYNPALRENPNIGSGDAVGLGEDVPKENTTSGSGRAEQDAVIYEF